jgi:hypothetical protein
MNITWVFSVYTVVAYARPPRWRYPRAEHPFVLLWKSSMVDCLESTSFRLPCLLQSCPNRQVYIFVCFDRVGGSGREDCVAPHLNSKPFLPCSFRHDDQVTPGQPQTAESKRSLRFPNAQSWRDNVPSRSQVAAPRCQDCPTTAAPSGPTATRWRLQSPAVTFLSLASSAAAYTWKVRFVDSIPFFCEILTLKTSALLPNHWNGPDFLPPEPRLLTTLSGTTTPRVS